MSEKQSSVTVEQSSSDAAVQAVSNQNPHNRFEDVGIYANYSGAQSICNAKLQLSL